MDTKNYQYFIKEFKQITKIDLSKYKEDQMLRRLENFLTNRGFKDFLELSKEIRTNAVLVEEIKSYITINFTEFLRNERMWDDFYKIAVPEISRNKRKVKIWSAACSSGEEPYTIAILMNEHYPHLDVEIIATDIDTTILEKAKKGLYKKTDIKAFDPKTLQKYFKEVDSSHIQVKDEIKKKIRFEKHNLLEDPYPVQADIIVCRNVLIYFKEESKQDIYKRFTASLLPGGILFIGATEQIFKPEQYNLKILRSFFYQKKKES